MHCLWRDTEANDRKSPNKVVLEMVCHPKYEGLGVLKLKTRNEALQLKNLHKNFNRQDIPWVQLIWEKYYTNGKLPANHVKKGSF